MRTKSRKAAPARQPLCGYPMCSKRVDMRLSAFTLPVKGPHGPLPVHFCSAEHRDSTRPLYRAGGMLDSSDENESQ